MAAEIGIRRLRCRLGGISGTSPQCTKVIFELCGNVEMFETCTVYSPAVKIDNTHFYIGLDGINTVVGGNGIQCDFEANAFVSNGGSMSPNIVGAESFNIYMYNNDTLIAQKMGVPVEKGFIGTSEPR